jgi:hypothetical protein
VARVDRLTAAGVLVLALMACLHALRLGLWKAGLPGSGLFPLLGAGGMALLAVLLLATSWRSPEQKTATPFWPRGDALKKQGVFAIALLVYPILVQLFGFNLGSLVFLVSLFRYPGRYGWKTSLVVGILAVGVLYASLVVLLGVELPTGLVGEWVPWTP